jgi:tetratricopeptide (TPR) repeat protein
MKAKKKAFPPAAPAPGRYGLACAALVALAALAFSNSFTTGLALDNQVLVTGDPRIREVTSQNVAQILQHTFWWPNGEAGIYRPLATLSYLFNYAVLGNGSQPAGYHWLNFLLHAVNVLLVFALMLRLLGGFRVPLFVAAVWAVHPVLTESVTNIVGRADLLAGMAVLGGFLLYLKSTDAAGSRRIAWLAGLGAATGVSVFSKESAVVLPGVIVLYELACRLGELRQRLRGLLWGCVAMILPIGLMLWQRSVVLRASPKAEFPFVDNPIAGADFWIGRLTALKVLAHYLWLVVWPWKLSADYSYAQIPLAHGSLWDWIAWIALTAIVCLIVFAFRRRRMIFFFACFGFLNLLPASNLLFPIGTIMAERLLYLPLVGFLACIVLLMQLFRRVDVVIAVIVAAFAVRTWARNLDWKDDLTMARAGVAASPNSFKTHRLLASALFQSQPDYSNIDQVLEESNKSLAILRPLPNERNIPSPWNEAAAYHLAKGDSLHGASTKPYDEAVQLAQRAIAIEGTSRGPVVADSYRLLATAYLRSHKADQALPAALQAQTLDRSSVDVYVLISDAYLAQSRGEDAAIALAEGMFATGDGNLRSDLLKLYQSGVDTAGCAVVAGSRGPALNPQCEMVRRDLCAGAERAQRMDLRRQLPCSN